jgi:hypothetical protein
MIGVFLGEQNSGKTLSMSYYGHEYHKRGFEIYANYDLSYPHTKLTKEVIETYTKNKQHFNKCVFMIDELYLFLDSRNFSRGINKVLSYFLLQTSKRNVHLFGTAQYLNTIEKRFRENAGFQCFCMRVLKYKDGTTVEVKDRLRFIDSDNLYIKQNFVTKTMQQGIIPVYQVKTFLLKAKPVFDMFDTTQLLGID